MPIGKRKREDVMRRYKLIGAALCAGVLAVWAGRADAEEFSARLAGFQELGSLPNVTQDQTSLVVMRQRRFAGDRNRTCEEVSAEVSTLTAEQSSHPPFCQCILLPAVSWIRAAAGLRPYV